MKKNIKNIVVKLIFVTFCFLIFMPISKAKDDKYKARISVDYISIMNDQSFLSINVKYKGANGYEPAVDLKLNIYEQLENDSLELKGETITNAQGNAEYKIEIAENLRDSLIKFEYLVVIENNEVFEDAVKSVKFSLSTIIAEALVIDSVNYINAKLTDAKGNPIEGEDLKLQLQRLFAPLTIGESSYETDDEGNVLIEIKDPMPGIEGVLTFVISLDSKKYGIVKKFLKAPIGTVIVDRSTFDQRTMWSPPNKTPIFLWIFPNLIILGIWFVIGLLVFNLIKIYKS